MNLSLRACALVALLTTSSTAFAQEDPVVPEDPTTVEPEETTPIETDPVSTEAPVGTVEVVGETPTTTTAPATPQAPPAPTAAAQAAVAPVAGYRRFRPTFLLQSEGTTANNLDMRPLDNETFIDIYDSDDRGTLIFTRLGAHLEYDVLDDTTVAVGASHSGAWGGDSIGAANAFGGIFYVDRLNLAWNPLRGESFQLGFTFGRQHFGIGGATHDFFLDDVIDGVVIEAGFGKGGKLRLMPIDMYALQRPDDFTFGAALGYAGPDTRESAVGFDGDTNTIRFGGVYENTELVDGLHFRVFGFYADIGAGAAPHTGADRVLYGAHGNFADNDYNWLAGTRVGYNLDGDAFDLGIYGEYARSGGLDRKAVQIGVRDVAASGNAFGAAVTPKIDAENLTLRLIGQFFMADGANYTGAEGLAFNYGFVSMKGDQIGGLAMSRFAGWHPTAYVGTRGVHFSPQDTSRKAGTLVVHGGVGVDLMEKLHLDLDLWWFKDNSSTGIDNFDNLDALADELPFGYTEADLIPQERLGKALGMELDGRLGYTPNEALDLYVQGGMFMPGAFYEIEIPRTGGTALGAESPATFWALLLGTTVRF